LLASVAPFRAFLIVIHVTLVIFSQNNPTAFYNGITGWLDEEGEVVVVYLYFSKAFGTLSHNILIGKLRKCGLDEWSVRWI